MHQLRPATRKGNAGFFLPSVTALGAAAQAPDPKSDRSRKRSRRRLVIGAFALLVAGALMFVALDSRKIYSPGAGLLARFLYIEFAALRGFETPIGFITIDAILRKIYALGAFALVGACFAPLFVRRERVAGATLAVAQFSTVIEIVQAMHRSPESLFSNFFDIASGAAGGCAGALFYGLVARAVRATRRGAPRP